MNWKTQLATPQVASSSLTVGTWDTATHTVYLPDGYTSQPNRKGPQIIIRPMLRIVDIPIGWTVASSPSPIPPPVVPPIADDMVELIAMHNLYRAQNGRPPLVEDPRLMASAGGYATDMMRRGVLSHFGADGSTPWDRMTRQGYIWSDASENIAEGQTSNTEVMQDWESSPGHRADILGPYVNIGVGRSGTYWVADFGSPK
jgi:uncharacterized protein YkwD